MGPSIFISRPAPSGRPHRLMLTLLLAFSSSFACVASHSSPSVVPEDIAYKSRAEPATAAVKVGTASIPGNSTPAVNEPPEQQTRYLSTNLCTDQSGNHVSLQKSLAVTRFLRTTPKTANGGNLFSIETEMPGLIRVELNDKYRSLSSEVLAYGFAAPDLTEIQYKQQAQKIARQSRSQFVLSGTIEDMGMANPEATYNPDLYRRAANAFHDVTTIKMFDKRTRVLQLSVQLRDGFTGEVLFSKAYSTSGIWNQRKPVGFDSPAFYRTHYGKNVVALAQTISRDLAEVVHCQPFMASVDAQPGQSQILLHGGANNGLHAGDSLSLYQVVVAGSNTEYQVNETRLVKRNTRLYLSEVYPSHSVAQVEGGSYLNGFYLAVGE
jgi:hypothetical protein